MELRKLKRMKLSPTREDPAEVVILVQVQIIQAKDTQIRVPARDSIKDLIKDERSELKLEEKEIRDLKS